MPDTHTHTIESGNARVSVEADDAARAVSEARRNWALTTADSAVKKAADRIRQYAIARFHLFPPEAEALEQLIVMEFSEIVPASAGDGGNGK